MTNYLDMSVETLVKTLRKHASSMRKIATIALPGDFQTSLLAVAMDYDRQVEMLELRDAVQAQSSDKVGHN
jgi:hypothetical protein